MAQAEDVVTADAVLRRSRDVWVVGPAAHRDHYVLRRQLFLGAILHRRHNRVRVLELSQAIDVLDLLIPKVHPGGPVDGLDVVLDGLGERRPVDLDGVQLGHLPAV